MLYYMYLLMLLIFTLLVALFLLADCDLVLFWYSKWMNSSLPVLKGKIVWITGASSGIGEELAYVLASRGAKLILSARRETELQGVLEKCQNLSPTDNKSAHTVVPIDLLQYDEHASHVESVIKQYGKVDYLVNNAGQSQRSVAMETALDVTKRLIDINTLGTISLTNAVLPYMVKERNGCIVVVSSIAGKIGSPLSAAYSASKHALQGYFNSLRMEIYSTGVKIISVCPGPIDVGTSRKLAGSSLDEKVTTSKFKESRMTVERCAYLVAVTMANKLDETWISLQPILFYTYVSQYAPLLASLLVAPAAVYTVYPDINLCVTYNFALILCMALQSVCMILILRFRKCAKCCIIIRYTVVSFSPCIG